MTLFLSFFKEKDKGDSKLNSVDAQTVRSSIHVLIKAGYVKQQQPWQQDDNDNIVLDFEALVYHSFSDEQLAAGHERFGERSTFDTRK